MRKSAIKKMVVLFAAGFFLLLATTHVFAHAASLWCYVDNHRVYVEAFFMGGKKVQGGDILVLDKTGKKLLQGKTDQDGLFDFAPPVEDEMKIILSTESGHGAEFKLLRQDFMVPGANPAGGN
ncbi:MAG: hypothetical protein KAG92_06400 [Deltaproteobacteria bacterium]|nr:hypothetical protein [Deltaproteobacteria bacterium]